MSGVGRIGACVTRGSSGVIARYNTRLSAGRVTRSGIVNARGRHTIASRRWVGIVRIGSRKRGIGLGIVGLCISILGISVWRIVVDEGGFFVLSLLFGVLF